LILFVVLLFFCLQYTLKTVKNHKSKGAEMIQTKKNGTPLFFILILSRYIGKVFFLFVFRNIGIVSNIADATNCQT